MDQKLKSSLKSNMGKYDFDQLVNRKDSYSVKWNDKKDNILPMWVADMDFHVLPDIKECIQKTSEVDAYGYIEVPEEYFSAYQSWWKKQHDIDISVTNMTFSTGVLASIDSILKHLLPPHSKVLVQKPVYHVFFSCIKNNGHEVVNNPLVFSNNEYSIDFNLLEKQLKDGEIEAFLLCNPHNPVGRIWSGEELKTIADLCEKYHVLLISDEIHGDIVEPGYRYNSILKYSNHAIALLAPTKIFNIAAIQSSVVATFDKELLNKISIGLGQDDLGEANYFAPDVTIAAFNKGEQWVKELNEYLYKNKLFIKEYIEEHLPQLSLVDNHATYLLWLDISHYSHDSEAFAKALKEETGLWVSQGKQFGEGGESFLRINIATSLKNVKDACSRLKTFINKHYE